MKKLTKHTPGPWAAKVSDFLARVEAADGFNVCTVYYSDDNGEATELALSEQANARLIAAAPELLRELKSAVFYIESFGGEVTENFAAGGNLAAVKQILAKAEGSEE